MTWIANLYFENLLLMTIVYKKTDEWHIVWQRVVQRATTNDNEWQRMTTSGATSDNEWQRVVILAKLPFFK